MSASSVLGFGLVALLCWAFALRAVPRAFAALGRRLGLRPSPLTSKRIARFQRIRRGHIAWALLITASTMSLFLEFMVNNRPLYVHFDETTRYPAVADWANFWLPGDPFTTNLPARDFGVDEEGDLDARSYARWVADPDTLETDALALEEQSRADEQRFRAKMAEQARERGLVYDPAEALPDWKLESHARNAERSAQLRALAPELTAKHAAILMPFHAYSPREQVLGLPGAPPHRPFQPGLPVLGTDAAGKEVLSQLLYGFRISFSFALVVAAFGYLVGVLVGGAMGYYGGWFDIIVQRVIEVWSNIPFLFTMMIIASVLRPGFWILAAMLVVLSGWIGITYTVRGEYYRERSRDYVQAARAVGVRDRSIMTRHILPNALVPVVTYLPFAIVGYMSALVSLDFLGFGLPPGTPSWGALLRQGSENIVNYPHLVIIPVIAFAGTLFCVTMVGEAVREAFDPRPHQRLR